MSNRTANPKRTAMSTDTDVAELASHLRLSTIRLARQIRQHADTGLSPTLLSALAVVDRHGPITPGQLAEHERVSRPTCTRTIAALVDQGLVARTPDPLDGRMAWLQVTAAGHRLISRTRRRGRELLAERIERLDPREVRTLERAAGILDRIVEDGR